MDIKEKLKQLYLEGKTRKEAREACNLSARKDNGRMSHLSQQLGLHWTWPLKNRKSGEPPADTEEPSETIPTKSRSLRPSPGFSSARERRERGIDESRFEPFRQGEKEDEFEKFIRVNLYG